MTSKNTDAGKRRLTFEIEDDKIALRLHRNRKSGKARDVCTRIIKCKTIVS